ncbi:MAG: hypothetical protein ABFS16_03415 [Bacteroidota bacterium]
MHTAKPNIYLFNPTCEYAVANGHYSWQPNKLLQKMELDLATLPLFFAQPDDKVIVENIPGDAYLESLKSLDISSPGFILKQSITSGNPPSFQIDKLCPWGWSPAAHKLLDPLKPSCSEEFKKSPVFNWKPEYRNLYSKKFALGILKELKAQFPYEHFIADNLITQVCTTKDEYEILLKQWGKLMVKAPWSSSGRGLQPITKTPIHPKVWEKLLGIVKDQGYAIVEPFLNKQLDLAIQFKAEQGKISFVGISNFSADKKGQYLGNNLNGLPENTSPDVKEFAEFMLQIIIEPLQKTVEASDLTKMYEGFFGVDTLIFRNEYGNLKINPCLEINVRQNMGLLSLHLEKLIHQGENGIFQIYYNSGITFLQFKTEMEKKYPLVLSDNKIKSGFFALTEAKHDTQFGAYILV